MSRSPKLPVESFATFSQNLDRLMTIRGLKNSWLAAIVGVSRELVRQWRNQESFPSEKYLKKLAEALNCLEVELTHPLYSSNIIKLMDKHGYTPETLADKTSIPLELLHAFINPCPEAKPNLLNDRPGVVGLLADAFSCTREDILDYPKPVETLSLNEWARRENIPITRARDLFDLGLVEGAIQTDFCILIPVNLVAPPNSKQLVTLTKKRPRFGIDGWDGFAERLNERMTAANISNIKMAEALNVVPTTVSHWRAGIRTPDESKLKAIAKLCKCFVADLLK